jgi:eukaryotic-like serine/threonine-protein kinase
MTEPSLPEESVFAQALEIADAAERAAFLERACGANRALRAEVEALLRVHERSGDLLDVPEKPPVTTELPAGEHAGTVIGPYKLLQQIGEGGMGVVWMAEQTIPMQRKVALKIVRPGMDSEQVLARFDAERQALALMDHPNIAKVHDAGATPEGRPYFAMELVKGQSITQYCDQHRLTPRQRLELFVPVCQAVQHAHQKGIIHRDLKPSNVLVAPYDGRPVVKVIDFGVAKAAGPRLTDKTLFTEFGAVVGTLEYMSPEQAELNNQDIDTRSDIYSLGVLLYELLTGSTPLEKKRLKQAAMLELLRLIRQEEPPKPSTRLSSTDELPSISAQRQMDPAKLTKLVRGELDWIVMKALEKDRNRRYETANALAMDVQRYLADEPVLACPPSAGYRLRKFARRNKRALATGALLGVMLLIALGAVVANAIWAADQAKARLALEAATKKKLERNLYSTRIALAASELGSGNVGRAAELLDECPEALRGWEWHYLKRLSQVPPMPPLPSGERIGLGHAADLASSPADGRLLAAPSGPRDIKIWDLSTERAVWTLSGHADRILRLAFSPDGRLLASGSEDKFVKVWDVTTGHLLCTCPHDGRVHGLTFSPDGRYLASAGGDNRVKVWETRRLGETESATPLRNFPGYFIQQRLGNVAFSPDGQFLASGGEDNTVKVWDVTTDREVHALRAHTQPVYSVAFTADGRRLASYGWDNRILVWDLATGQPAFPPLGRGDGDTSAAWSMALSPDGRRLAQGGAHRDGTITLYDTLTGQTALTLHGHTERVACLVFSPDGKRLASASFDKTVRLWDTETGEELLALRGHEDLVGRVLFDPRGWRLASSSEDGTVRIWDGTPLGEDFDPHVRTLRTDAGIVYDVAFSADGRWLASGGGQAGQPGEVKVWDPATAQELFALPGHTNRVFSVAFSPEGLLATASADGTVKFWDPRTRQEMGTLPGFRGGVHSMALSPDGRRLATCDTSFTAQLWDLTTRGSVPLRGHEGFVHRVVFSPSGKRVATAGVDGKVRLWDPSTGAEVFTFRGHATRVLRAVFSPDSELVASADTGGKVLIWNAATGSVRYTLPGDGEYVLGLAFNPNGQRLAVASWKEVKVWALTKREATPRKLGGLAGTINGVAFSPDSHYLAAGGGYKGKGEIKIWDRTLWDKQGDQ